MKNTCTPNTDACKAAEPLPPAPPFQPGPVVGCCPVNHEDTPSTEVGGDGSTGSPIYVDVKISGDANNVVEIRDDGLFVTFPPPSGIVFEDSATVDIEGAGTSGDPLTINVNVSASDGNILQTKGDGLYVAVPALVHEDTPTVDLSGAGTTLDPLKADVIVSDDAGNALEVRANGLFVVTPAPFELVTKDSGTTSISGNGTTGNPLEVNVNIDASADNPLKAGENGLYVVIPECEVVVADTLSVDMSGVGTVADPIKADVILSKQAGNAITQLSDGLYVSDSEQVPVHYENSDSVEFGGVGTIQDPLTAIVVIDPTPGNPIESGPNGLIVTLPAPFALNIQDTVTVDLGGNGEAGTPLTADVIISDEAGNALTTKADGLYVATAETFSLNIDDTATVDLSGDGKSGTPLKADVKISADAGNVISAKVDGIYASVTTFELSHTDTNSVALDGAGTEADPLKADLNVSAVAGNVLTVVPDGAYVPTPTISTIDGETIELIGDGSPSSALTAEVISSADAGNLIEVRADGLYVGMGDVVTADGQSVSVSGVGSSGDPVTAEVIISAEAGNILETKGDGLYAPAADTFTLNTEDTATIDLSGDGTSGAPLKADIKVSADSGNVLTTKADGAFAARTEMDVQHDNTDGIALDGVGTPADPITAEILVSADAGNVFEIRADGVYVPPAGETKVSTENTGTVTLDGFGTSTEPLAAEVVISAESGNVLSSKVDGLYASATTDVQIIDTATVNLSGNGTVGTPLKGDVLVSAESGNILATKGDGLFVGTGTVFVTNSDTVSLSGSGTNADPIVGEVEISTTAGNSLTAEPDGLYVEEVIGIPPGGAIGNHLRKSSALDFAVEWSSGVDVVNVVGATHDIALTDSDRCLRFTNVNAKTLTIPPDSSVDFRVGTVIQVMNYAVNLVTVQATGPAVLNHASEVTASVSTYNVGAIMKVAANTWIIFGALVPA